METRVEPGWDGKVVKFISRHSRFALTAPDDSQGAWVVQREDRGEDRQRWRFTAVAGSVAYKIVNVGSGKVLEVLEASPIDGTAVDQWDDNGGRHQQWKVTPDKDSDGAFYRIENVRSGKALEVSGGPHPESLKDGARIIQWTYLNAVNQKWLIPDVWYPQQSLTQP